MSVFLYVRFTIFVLSMNLQKFIIKLNLKFKFNLKFLDSTSPLICHNDKILCQNKMKRRKKPKLNCQAKHFILTIQAKVFGELLV